MKVSSISPSDINNKLFETIPIQLNHKYSIFLSLFWHSKFFFISQSVSLIFVPTHLPFFLCFCLSLYTFLTLFFYVTLSLCLSASMSLCLTAFRSLCLSASSSLCLSVLLVLSVSLSLYLSVSVSVTGSLCLSSFYLSGFYLLSAFYSEQHPSCLEYDLMLQQFSVFDHKVERNKKSNKIYTQCVNTDETFNFI